MTPTERAGDEAGGDASECPLCANAKRFWGRRYGARHAYAREVRA